MEHSGRWKQLVRSRRSRRPSSLFRLSAPLGQMGQTHAGCGGAGRNATCHVSTTLTHIFEPTEEENQIGRDAIKRALILTVMGSGIRHRSKTNAWRRINQSKAKITSKICKKLFLFDEKTENTLKLLMRNCTKILKCSMLEAKLYVK